MNYPARIDITVFTDVMEELTFPVAYFDENGTLVPVSLAGRQLRFMARTPNADAAAVLLDSDADSSVCEPLGSDSTYVRLMIPSNLTAALDLGAHEYSIIDNTDAASEGEQLITRGTFTVQRQAVR